MRFGRSPAQSLSTQFFRACSHLADSDSATSAFYLWLLLAVPPAQMKMKGRQRRHTMNRHGVIARSNWLFDADAHVLSCAWRMRLVSAGQLQR